MKTLLFLFFFVLSLQFSSAQTKTHDTSYRVIAIKKSNFVKDTLWVMDSVLYYNSIGNNLQLTGLSRVLTRDNKGNELTEIGLGNSINGYLQNVSFDSVEYFENSNQVRYRKTFGWDSDKFKWMDNKYVQYNETGKITESYNKSWNIYDNHYSENGYRATYFLDSTYSKTEIDKFLSESNTWQHRLQKIYYKYDTNGFSKALTLVWDTNSNQWINNTKTEYFFNSTTWGLDYYKYVWDTVQAAWVYTAYTHSVHDEINRFDSTSNYLWDNETGDWVNDTRSYNAFNEAGKSLQYTSQQFNREHNSWINTLKKEYEYSELNTISINYSWSISANSWIPDYRSTSSRTEDSTIASQQHDKWDTIAQQWVATSRITSNFDIRHNQTRNFLQIWNNTTGNWETTRESDYYWSPFKPQSIPEIIKPDIKVYPNPVSSTLTIRIPNNIDLYNTTIRVVAVSGQSLFSTNPSSRVAKLDLTGLQSGLYLIQIQTGNMMVTKSVIKQ